LYENTPTVILLVSNAAVSKNNSLSKLLSNAIALGIVDIL